MDNGKGILTVTSASPFTSLSFVHSQNPGQNGFVIERVTVDVDAVPVPWETDALPVVGSMVLFGLGVWTKRKRKPSKSSAKDNTKDS